MPFFACHSLNKPQAPSPRKTGFEDAVCGKGKQSLLGERNKPPIISIEEVSGETLSRTTVLFWYWPYLPCGFASPGFGHVCLVFLGSGFLVVDFLLAIVMII